ncbi:MULTISPECIES: DUF4422 domain-containing protein [Collinsella]|uniref:DUF4422 domain-containing protein n=1 Tax=Collinsella ihumii TaxID=1720204 RepID=A0AAW7JQQ2_9ACTN|nr:MULTISPECIES: DUF4422 domain-containing protein [Collinsella]MDN0069402.1 DUF4422 domain-containing protein [Collinsella ihumii]OUO61949.1 glycosyl transferase [Collinsella sp. An271]
MPRPKIRIAVASHKPYRMPSDSVYIPLHVGRSLHPELTAEMDAQGFLGDDSGDSISGSNASLCELTGLWWLWRNVDADWKGLVHYRRHFASRRAGGKGAGDRFGRIASERDFLRAMSGGAEAILPSRRNYVIETVGSHWEHTQPSGQLASARGVVADMEPRYLGSLDRVLSSRGAHMFNMMVMRDDVLDAYCSWLFPLIFELVERHDPDRYDAFAARYPGRISELLLDAWMSEKHVPYAEMPTVSPEPVDWVRKGSSFLAAKFLGRKYGSSF